jgi:uncharacterized protein YdiU (UPF0061 family)
MASNLGLTEEDLKSQKFIDVFSGKQTIEHTQPYAMCYGGHQFGNWAGQLGDGRAINLTEIEYNGKNWALQLKGSGATPYSRRGDGLAVLRSSVREHLCSEAMYHLGVPTTRSLSLMLTGDEVLRDVMYDGNPAMEKGAVVCRAAESFIRFGNFEIFASRQDKKTLKLLTDFTIKNFYPEITLGAPESYEQFFQLVADRTLKMIVDWQRVGFVHGVMNTDNLSILGLTIDYGPYGWLEGFDLNWTPNTTDRNMRRYRFGQQPGIGLWNLAKLGNAISLLTENPEPLQKTLDNYRSEFRTAYLKMMNAKLGLEVKEKSNEKLLTELVALLQSSETDMTIFFRNLADYSIDAEAGNFMNIVGEAFYKPAEINGPLMQKWTSWFLDYKKALKENTLSDTERKKEMNRVNPKYVLRNYMAQLAIDAADKGDYSIISELHEMLKTPYDENKKYQKWFAKRPEWARNKIGCSMLSCSS